jgi:ubiquinone/menaquinone biosynthesis C-methylase UbiE
MPAHWLSRGFISLTECSKNLTPALWRWLYNQMAKRDAQSDLLFMNYGFEPMQSATFRELAPEDQPFRLPIQLYDHVLSQIVLEQKDVLEVGCGRGGGGSFLLRYEPLRSFIGVDLSEVAIDRCRARHVFPHAQWVQGAADALPLSDASVDVVLNVESSHCYPSMEGFLREVKRVLRPQGYFAWCDLRSSESMQRVSQYFQASGLVLVHEQVITSEVLRALDQLSDERERTIIQKIPRLIRPAFRDFIGLKNTGIYNQLKVGAMEYRSALWRKE